MATGGFGLAETYVMRKLYKEKMNKMAQQEEEEGRTIKKIHTITTGSEAKTSSGSGCFSWLSKQERRKNSRITDSNENEAANT